MCSRDSKKNTGDVVAALCKSICIEMTGMELSSIIGAAVQDRAALSVPDYIGLDEAEACDMHDGDKIGRTALGELVRSKNKVA